MTDKYNSDEVLAKAREALNAKDADQVEQLYTHIVTYVQKAFNSNQRDVAAELQRLAKSIESTATVEDALAFKQRTCEIMLKISMAERHKGKQAPATTPPPPALPF